MFQNGPPTDKPRLVFMNDPLVDQQSVLYLDGVPITECGTVLEGMASLFAAYFVFNVQYETKARNICLFIEKYILLIEPAVKLPEIVPNFINSVEIQNA